MFHQFSKTPAFFHFGSVTKTNSPWKSAFLYILGEYDKESIKSDPEFRGFNETKEIKKIVEKTGGNNHIHVQIYYRDITFDVSPFTFNNTIKIILDDNIKESPILNKDGNFVIWEEDILSPLFINLLIEKMNSMLCGRN